MRACIFFRGPHGEQIAIDEVDLRTREASRNRESQGTVSAADIENALRLLRRKVLEEKQGSFVDALGRKNIVRDPKFQALA